LFQVLVSRGIEVMFCLYFIERQGNCSL